MRHADASRTKVYHTSDDSEPGVDCGAIVTHRPYAAAPPPPTDWDAPAPYKGNLAMLLQAMIATEDGPAAALAASMMAETNTPMAPLEEALVA